MLIHWIWLATRAHISDREKLAVLTRFRDPEDIFYADGASYREIEGLSEEALSSLKDKDLHPAGDILRTCMDQDIRICTFHDGAYPAALKNIPDPPVVLYCRGKLPDLDGAPVIAVVGTRKASVYGLNAAKRIGAQLARCGAVVVSGLAAGIDGAGMAGALTAGGCAVGVLGCGVDVVYPMENSRLYEDVASSGVLLAEYPPGTEPNGWHFPARNRILSGLCLATLVVEAPEKSGALITAATALEQGRDVYAVPGQLDAESSVGCNRLIRDGAGLATESWDILREYHSRYPHKLHPDGEKLPPLPKRSDVFYSERKNKPKAAPSGLPVINVRRNAEGLTDDQIKVLKILDDKVPMLTDDIAIQANVPVRRILSAVTMLEIDGFTRQEGLRKFVRTVEVEDTKE